VKGLIDSFRYAFAGIGHATTTQRNFRIHIVISLAVIAAGLLLSITVIEWAILAVTISVVLQAELFNTALEAIVDKVSPEFHALAKVAKDCAAGAVVVTAIGAVVVGIAIFGPRLLLLIGQR
jgi:diacylglycerol kinase (ATP)